MEKISTTAERLKEALEKKQLKQTDLVNRTGLQKSAISQYISGKVQPKQDNIYKIAKALNVSETWLMGYDVPSKKSDYFSVDNIIPLPKMESLPIIGTIACGEPILASQNIDGYFNVEKSLKADFCLRCKGDSMINARIFDGDVVFIKNQPDVEDGEIAAVLIDGEATLKRVYKMPGRITLRAENPNFKPIELKEEDMKDIRIIGKAVGFCSVF